MRCKPLSPSLPRICTIIPKKNAHLFLFFFQTSRKNNVFCFPDLIVALKFSYDCSRYRFAVVTLSLSPSLAIYCVIMLVNRNRFYSCGWPHVYRNGMRTS